MNNSKTELSTFWKKEEEKEKYGEIESTYTVHKGYVKKANHSDQTQ